jgi:hypothetical protein
VKGQIPGVSGALTGVRSFQTSVGGRWVVLLPRRKNVMGDFIRYSSLFSRKHDVAQFVPSDSHEKKGF